MNGMNAKASNRWITCPRPNPQATIRLFCFPYAGEGSLIFRNWPDQLPPGIETCLVQLPGRGARMNETAFRELRTLVEATDQAMSEYLDKPLALFGHSMGAMICFELAHLLRRERGIEPMHLFVSGRRAPQICEAEAPTYNLPEAEFIQELRRLNGTPREVLDHPELMAVLIPILRADFSVCQTYTYSPKPLLGCPITAFGGLADVEAPREQMEGWREQTASSFSMRMFPGDHFFIHSAQSLVLRVLSQEIYQHLRPRG